MRILWLYKYDRKYNFDKWLHLEYVRHVKQLGYDIIAYGPRLEEEYYDIMLVPYRPSLSWEELIDMSGADIAILNTRSRAFEHYSPFTGEKQGCWLPDGFAKSKKVIKVLIDEDAHYEKDDLWVKEMGFSLTLQRHKSQADRKDWVVKTKWLPFSVNTSIFTPQGTGKRINKVCFTGSMTEKYTDRQNAIRRLYNYNLIDIFPTGIKRDQEYLDCLRSYKCCLSGASNYDICAAKNFEIMASGAVLLTNNFTGIRDLFYDDTYSLYDNDNDNIIARATKILFDDGYAEHLSKNALNCIKARHTDEIRTKQLIEILNKEL